MRLFPYESFAGIAFGASESAVVSQFGEPKRRGANQFGETELDYGNLIIRVAQDGGVQEMSAAPPVVTVAEQMVPRANLPEWLRQVDSDAVEHVGFVVSLRFGVAVDTTPEEGNWVTAFMRGRWDSLLNGV